MRNAAVNSSFNGATTILLWKLNYRQPEHTEDLFASMEPQQFSCGNWSTGTEL